MKTILIVEDDQKTSSLVALYLDIEGFQMFPSLCSLLEGRKLIESPA